MLSVYAVSDLMTTHTTHIAHREEQMSNKKQDQTYSGHSYDAETSEEFDWSVLFDGHGTDAIIQKIRTTDLTPFIQEKDPITSLWKFMNENHIVKPREQSGATMCATKIYKDRIICSSAGDSQILVYKNGEQIYGSTPHKWSNPAENARLKSMHKDITFATHPTFRLISDAKMTLNPSGIYTVFPDGRQLSMTQAIGHNGLTGICPEVREIPINEMDEYKIIMASDGLFDMTLNSDLPAFSTKTCDELIQFAKDRWTKTWSYVDENEQETVLQSFRYTKPDHFDDISVVVMDVNNVM